MELAAVEPWMRVLDHIELDHLGERLCIGARGDHHARRFEARHIVVVDFIAMTMTLTYRRALVDTVCECVGTQRARLRAQAHGAAQVGGGIALFDHAVVVLPFGDEGHHRMRRRGIEFGRVGVCQPDDIARKFDRRDLHAKTNTEIGNFIFAGEFHCRNLAFGAAFAETAGNQNRIHAGECRDAVFLDLFRIEVMNIDLGAGMNTGVDQCLR